MNRIHDTIATTPLPMPGFEEFDFEGAFGFRRVPTHPYAHAQEAARPAKYGQLRIISLDENRWNYAGYADTSTFEMHFAPTYHQIPTGGIPESEMEHASRHLRETFTSFKFAAIKAQARGEATRPLPLFLGSWITCTTHTAPHGNENFTVVTTTAPHADQVRAADPEWNKWFDKLQSLEKRPNDWTLECGALPSSEVIASVKVLLELLCRQRSKPSRLSRSVIGGIGITFKGAKRKVYVEFSNKGSVHALFADGVTDPKVEKISPNETGYSGLIARIKTYLHE